MRARRGGRESSLISFAESFIAFIKKEPSFETAEMATRWPRQEILSLPISPTYRNKLHAAGYHTVQDLQDVSIVQLAQDLNLPNEEALKIVSMICISVGVPAPAENPLGKARTAAQLLDEEERRPKIFTFNQDFDKMLGGGVFTGAVTEFCGVPGVGKTQLGMQLAINVQLPAALGGAGGEAIYIDTEGSFMSDRIRDMANGLLGHLARLSAADLKMQAPEKQAAVAGLTPEHLLSRIHYYRVHDYHEQLAVVEALPALMDELGNRVRLVVIDSIAFHFRQDFSNDMSRRTRLLAEMAQSLMSVAEERHVAVVLINQVTTKPGRGPNGSGSVLVPALGDSWAHAATSRIVLFWEGSRRMGHLYKSPSLPPGTALFDITAEGFRRVSRTKRAREGGQAGGGSGGGAGGAPPAAGGAAGAPPDRTGQQGYGRGGAGEAGVGEGARAMGVAAPGPSGHQGQGPGAAEGWGARNAGAGQQWGSGAVNAPLGPGARFDGQGGGGGGGGGGAGARGGGGNAPGGGGMGWQREGTR